jgi:SAM-dependent methyltransferase
MTRPNRLDLWIRALQVLRADPAYASRRLLKNSTYVAIARKLFQNRRRNDKATSYEEFLKRDWDKIRYELEECLNLECCPVHVEPEEYERYLSLAKYRRGYAPTAFAEKTLEHFLSAKYLDICSDDVYVDIASASSPFPDIVRRLCDCTVYRQDLLYRAGVHRDRIGGDACHIPLPDCSVSKMALHCSFEHFEGDSDILFIQEANRLLQEGGRLCIVPLYLAETYTIFSDPKVSRKGIEFDSDARVVDVPGFSNRFGRQYTPQRFKDRIVNEAGTLSLRILYIDNAKEIDESCYVKLVALFEKRKIEPLSRRG